jgi:hypothetical protein
MKPVLKFYENLYDLVSNVKEELRSRGYVIPVKHPNGCISMGNFFITKDSDGYYNVIDRTGRVDVNKFNLPYTAILVANTLALGKSIDNRILRSDQAYGYGASEETQLTCLIKNLTKQKEWDRAEIISNKRVIAHKRAETARRFIMNSFLKFSYLR